MSAPIHSLVPPVVSLGPSVSSSSSPSSSSSSSSSSSFLSPVASFQFLHPAPTSLFVPSGVPGDPRSSPGVSAGPGFFSAFVCVCGGVGGWGVVLFGCLMCCA